MDDRLNGVEFTHYVRERWAVVVASCLVAVVLAGSVSLLLPKRYTATASILIEPPAGNDPRGATAVSPVYLESLKTYERFASSDSVFASALDRLGLRQKFGGQGIESIKRRVLKVSRPVSTKIVEISATLDDPEKAQKLAQSIAEQSVALNQKLNNQSSEEIVREARRMLEAAILRMKETEQRRDEFANTQSVEALQSEVAQANQLRLTIEQDLGRTRVELADMTAQSQSFHAGDGLDTQAQWTLREVGSLKARVAVLEQQEQALTRSAGESARTLEGRKQKRESLDVELRSAHAEYEAQKTKLADIQSSAAFRGERLDIMDPGIVPQRPSFPNTPLNVLVGALLSLAASVGYLAARFGYSRAYRYSELPEYSMR